MESLSIEEKIEILKAYMDGGGVKGLTQMDYDMQIDPAEENMINEAFAELYAKEEKLRALLSENLD